MNRNIYLDKLIRKKHNGMIKVITGMRRSGKSYLLFRLFYQHLIEEGIKEDHIIRLSLDDRQYKEYRDPDVLYAYLKNSIKDNKMYYILLDEVQYVREFEDVLNSLLHIDNADTYVIGSNARFLSKDIITEFRGRGDQVHIYPLSFSEFLEGSGYDLRTGWMKYTMYGGLPKLLEIQDDSDKASYLRNIFEETYIKDILERYEIRQDGELNELLNIIASGIGGLTNPKKISDTFRSLKNVSVHQETIRKYLDYLEDSFLVSKVNRYDVKGRKYINTPMKYYFTDIGLRNARLNFRQYEESHIMENIIYNELLIRGYNVDVGMVTSSSYEEGGKRVQKQLEVDFVCNQESARIYIQSALSLESAEKKEQETASLKKTGDSFRKVVIVRDSPTHYDETGILILNLFDFLTDSQSLMK